MLKSNCINITLRELVEGYADNNENGVVAFGGKLNVRPPYQREFVYGVKQRDEVIKTVRDGLPLGLFYWAKTDDGYEVIDGQQRTISICQYIKGDYSIDGFYFHSLADEDKESILNYIVDVRVFEGTASEKLQWFYKVNIASVVLTEQELRNAAYVGRWLYEAKKHFSKIGCPAYQLGNKYIKGEVNRQDYLETALKWIVDSDERYNTIEDYMSYHQNDTTAAKLWTYYMNVINWVQLLFPNYRKEMKGIQWGLLYNKYHAMTEENNFDATEIEQRIVELMADEDVTAKKGIYEYILDNDERHLNVRAFSSRDKRTAYTRQNGLCPHCGRHFEIDEMEADHIIPWSEGGHTDIDNLQMLCKNCNRAKSNR